MTYRFITLALAALLATTGPAIAQKTQRYACTGAVGGVKLDGALTRTWLITSQTWSYTGAFVGSDRNRYEFEVNMNAASGTGGAWRNHQRHREAHIRLNLTQSGFTIHNTRTGEGGQFRCG